jgi:hypothetical protein
MLHAKQASSRRRRSKAVLTAKTEVKHEIALREEEISDVSLATFYVFDNENAPRLRQQLPGGGCSGGGCACFTGCGG